MNETKILLIEDNPGDARLIREFLSESLSTPLVMVVAETLREGIARLAADVFDIILLDLSLPDSQRLETLRGIRRASRRLPVVILTGANDEELALEALQSGAQDYLIKGEIDGRLLARTLRYALERKKIEEEKAQLTEQLRQSQKLEALGTLSGGIAHDFNNILAAIMGFSELSINTLPQGHPVQSHLSEIINAATRARDLVRQILAFSRKSKADLRPLDCNREIRACLAILSRTIPKMVTLESRLVDDIGAIRGDSRQLGQVLINLGTNAADAMPEGGELLFSTSNVRLGGQWCACCGKKISGDFVSIKVSDTGHGMDAETMEKIFDPFFTTKDVGKGTGLGLSTAYGIISSHEGHIVCQSEVGKGTVFEILLPRSENAPDARETDSEAPRKMPPGHGTILLVDDEPCIREMAHSMLAPHGYNTLKAASGEEALVIFDRKSAAIDLVLLDIGMPGMGGYKCFFEMKKIDAGVPVVVASGYVGETQLQELQAQGIAGIVTKPYRQTDLLRCIRAVLDRGVASFTN